MKVERTIKISEQLTTHVPHLNKLYHKKALDKIISTSKDVKHTKSNRIDRYSHIMRKTERHLRSFFAICHTIFK